MFRVDGNDRAIPHNVGLVRIADALKYILAGVLLFGLATGGLFPLIGLRLQEQGASDLLIGLITSVFFAGTFAGALLTEHLIAAIRHVRTFSLLAAIAGASTIGLVLSEADAVWVLLRFVTGFCLGGYYVVVESWVNHASPNETRARSLSLYEAVRMLGIAISPLLLGLGAGYQPYILAGILFIIALVPILFCNLEEPEQNAPGNLPFSRLLVSAPLGLVAAFISGAVNAAFYGMSGVYGERAGFDTTEIAFFIAAMLIAPVLVRGRMID